MFRGEYTRGTDDARSTSQKNRTKRTHYSLLSSFLSSPELLQMEASQQWSVASALTSASCFCNSQRLVDHLFNLFRKFGDDVFEFQNHASKQNFKTA